MAGQSYLTEKTAGGKAAKQYGEALSAYRNQKLPEAIELLDKLLKSKTDFKEVGRENYRGRECTVFDFSVAEENSNYLIEGTGPDGQRQQINSAYEGRLWVDTTSKRVLRIEQFAVQMPRDFLFSQAETAVEYDWIEIGEKQYWLPISAENQIGSDRYDYHTRNIIKFYDYRKFEAEVKILD